MLPCGHLEGHMYRARHKGRLYKYCMMCMFEKIGMPEIGEEPKKEKVVKGKTTK